MKLSLIGVGKIKRGPERTLVDDYMGRASKLGPSLGVRQVTEIEVDAGHSQEQECDRLVSKIPDGSQVYLFDESGRDWTSIAFSKELENRKDQGCPHAVFLIGGADGYTDAMKQVYPDKIRLGSLTWPHKLVRVLAAEQIYRALSLMAGTPYHRE